MDKDTGFYPRFVIFVAGLGFLVVGLSGMKSFKTHRERYPELAIKNGYFVSNEEARLRGGVGNHVTIPSGSDIHRVDLYRKVSRFAIFHRSDDGDLMIHLKPNSLFANNSSDLTPASRQKLDDLADLMNSEGIQTSEVTGLMEEEYGSASASRTLALERTAAVHDYIDTKRGVRVGE